MVELQGRKNIFAQIFEPMLDEYDEEKSYKKGKKRKGEEQEEEFQRKEDFEDRHMKTVKERLDSLKDVPGFDEMDLPKQLGIITAVVGKDVAEEYGKGAKIKSDEAKKTGGLTLNESINQTHKTFDKNREDVLVKHGQGVIKDMQGNLVFDFKEMGANKDKVIKDLLKNESGRKKAVQSHYKRANEIPGEGEFDDEVAKATIALENGTQVTVEQYSNAMETVKRDKPKLLKRFKKDGDTFTAHGVPFIIKNGKIERDERKKMNPNE